MAAGRPASRVSVQRVLDELRRAARKGDRSALSLALDQMRTLAHSPRYWERYLQLLRHPLARLVDLLVLKQGDRIVHQKGWKRPRPAPAAPARPRKARQPAASSHRPERAGAPQQPSLFE